MQKVGLDVGIKIAGRNINNLRYADDITLMAESEEELKNLLMRVKEERDNKPRQNLNKQRHHLANKGQHRQKLWFFQ